MITKHHNSIAIEEKTIVLHTLHSKTYLKKHIKFRVKKRRRAI